MIIFWANQYCYDVLLFTYLQIMIKPKQIQGWGWALELAFGLISSQPKPNPNKMYVEFFQTQTYIWISSDWTALTDPKLHAIAEWVENLLSTRSTRYRCFTLFTQAQDLQLLGLSSRTQKIEAFTTKRKQRSWKTKQMQLLLNWTAIVEQQIAEEHYNKIDKYKNIHLQEEAVGCFNSNPGFIIGLPRNLKSLQCTSRVSNGY